MFYSKNIFYLENKVKIKYIKMQEILNKFWLNFKSLIIIMKLKMLLKKLINFI
jgi:hypothetical protein